MARFMVRVYFNNMVAINLFHEPTFNETVANFANPVHICALVAAMCSFSAKFYAADLESAAPGTADLLRAEAETHSPDRFIAMALKFVDEALVECDDEPPPSASCRPSSSPRTASSPRASTARPGASSACACASPTSSTCTSSTRWSPPARGRQRSSDPIRWRDAEEKRRAWWAVWEMDVFASTVRRTPTAIDWAHMETLLPVDDADWFRNEPAPSTFMEPDPVQRWKVLQETGNHSPKAWYLVINSLMKDAQIISSPRGVPFQPDLDQRRRAKSLCRKTKRLSTSAGPSPVEEARQRLAMLANSVQCFVLALPQHLRYRNQYLGFDPPVPGQVVSVRQLHCGIYNIYVMTQLARLMIHRYDMFGTHAASRQAGHADPDDPCVRQYFEAADNILMVVNRSCEDHIQHINPFLPSTIWLAAAVQLVRKYIGGPGINQGLIKSRFDVLYLTYKRCVEFWDTKTAMEQNLESLEMQLEGQQPTRTGGGKESSARQEARALSSGKERPADLGPPPSRERSSKRLAGADEQAGVDRGLEERPGTSSRSKDQTSHNPARTLPDTAETPPLPQFVPNSPRLPSS
ncbi:unnamed protein product [Parascedosporium putredinis]|uniref:Xylanolytic transcriptional activator regulatory domain-containing protein n=1 Tax=Parascedosporium putredinis TaxID=1442378 RepID=A0A9P1MEW9_9PEZI|nr:unnamed protein product [Parascedosporium putredinis]CAI8002284.1 unnamed protein product [Parascedosporium putredinis]